MANAMENLVILHGRSREGLRGAFWDKTKGVVFITNDNISVDVCVLAGNCLTVEICGGKIGLISLHGRQGIRQTDKIIGYREP